MKWTERVILLKKEQYEKKDALKYVQDFFIRKNITFSVKHKVLFEQAWRTPVRVNPTIEDIVPEIDLPKDLTKIRPIQETQILNYFKHLDRADLERRWKLISIALNLAHARNKPKDVASFTILSDIIYKTKMVKRYKITSSTTKGLTYDTTIII
jgi:hypothetical protein